MRAAVAGPTQLLRLSRTSTATSLEPHQGPRYFDNGYRLAAADFDGDGEVDLLIASEADGRLHYHRQLSGRLQAEELWHPFSNITVKSYRSRWGATNVYHLVQPFLLDWDGDGDVDLLLGLPDGTLFRAASRWFPKGVATGAQPTAERAGGVGRA